MNKITTIYLVRHAQSENNRRALAGEAIIKSRGETLGTPLTEEGREQAYMLANELKTTHFDVLIASHLNRAQETAAILGKELNLPIRTIESLQERTGAESEKEAGIRLSTCLQAVALEQRGKTVLLVSHGAIMRGFLVLLGFASLDELPPGSVRNTGYALIKTDGDACTVIKTQNIVRTPLT